ncbi:alpha/beta hydrolase [bacterium]|jgi:pimeloyl-ACP methyl ester carboxylesterase|nr:alpha/beta hydrolase [bacterium]MDB4443459.1 alpha/beta hydrolase [Saprospiraceae bacterium]
MSPQLSTWKNSGEYIFYSSFQHQLFVKQLGNSNASTEKTLLLIHGFPESSYSYHAVVDGLLEKFDRIILFDMLGYGLSDKPTKNYTYSLFEQADTVFEVWKHFNIKGGHLLSHDMGDSVSTEIVARHENGLMPAWFSEGLQSLTFTNGSMVLELASLRITQKILLSNYGYLMKNLSTFTIFNQQIRSAHGNENLSADEINVLWEANTLQDGHKKSYLTIKYLNDRKRFEKTRWLPALAQTKLPIHICWGNEDAVAKVEMAHYLKEKICKNATLTIMEGLGHFCQLGSPEKWVKYVSNFYKN